MRVRLHTGVRCPWRGLGRVRDSASVSAMSPRSLLATGLRDLARAMVPVACPGCLELDVRLCGACAAPWWSDPVRVEGCAPRLDIAGRAGLPVWAIAAHGGAVAGVVGAWKDGARRDLDAWMRAAMTRAAGAVGPVLHGTGAGRVAVVPAPSRPASTRRRGVDLPRELARGAVDGLREAGMAAEVRPVLSIGAGESRGRSARGRWRDASRSVACAAAPRQPVLLIDDVLTTGATLASCAGVLERRGASVLGAIVATYVDSGRADPARGLG